MNTRELVAYIVLAALIACFVGWVIWRIRAARIEYRRRWRCEDDKLPPGWWRHFI